MKKTHLAVFAISMGLLFSCSPDTESQLEEVNLTQSVTTITADQQVPQIQFDSEKKGIYLGIVASKNTQSRGNIWINVGNDDRYTAIIKMADGDEIKLLSNSSSLNDQYEFRGTNGSLKVDLSNFDAPVVTEVVLNNHDYFASIVKNGSHNRALAVTGIFFETGRPGFNGTWNLISDGTIVNPNGFGGEAITSMVMTKNGAMFTETVFETFSFELCGGGPPAWVPTLGSGIGSPLDGIQSWGQSTDIGAVNVQWDLIYNTFEPGYFTNACEAVGAGFFTWTSPNGNIKIGEIYVDFIDSEE